MAADQLAWVPISVELARLCQVRLPPGWWCTGAGRYRFCRRGRMNEPTERCGADPSWEGCDSRVPRRESGARRYVGSTPPGDPGDGALPTEGGSRRNRKLEKGQRRTLTAALRSLRYPTLSARAPPILGF